MINSLWLPREAAKAGQKPAKGAQVLQMWKLDEKTEVCFKKMEPLQSTCGISRVDGECEQGTMVIMCTLKEHQELLNFNLKADANSFSDPVQGEVHSC